MAATRRVTTGDSKTEEGIIEKGVERGPIEITGQRIDHQEMTHQEMTEIIIGLNQTGFQMYLMSLKTMK